MTNRRRPRPEQSNEEVFFEMLVQIAGDLRSLRNLAYWVVGLNVLAGVLVFVATLAP
jgi:hypothetical protein